jgi:putative MATE family efflux protein
MKTPSLLSLKGSALKRDWTQGSIFGNLWLLSWPLLVTYTINALGPTIDMVWIGRLGTASIAGVGVSATAIVVVNALLSGIFTGTSALIARFMGAKDEASANQAAQQAFVIGGTFSFLMALIGIFLAEPILRLLGVSEEVIADGAVYLRIQMVGIITLSAVTVAQSIMQSSGDTFTPMKISIGYRILQMALCPAMVFGWWIFPSWGVGGASLSNVIAQGVGGGIALWYLFNGRSRLHVTLKRFHLNFNLIWRTIKIGIPASISFTERAFADLILVGFITSFGTFAVAAHSLAQRIDQFVQNLGGGLGTPAAVLAGQNMGAGRPDRAARTAWLAVGLATGVAILFCIIIWLWVEPILGIFSADPETIRIAATFLKIQTVGYLVWGLVVVLSLVLNGVGDTLVMMFTNLLTMWGVQIALAYFLSRYTSLDVNGIRWAVVAGILVRGIIYPAYFASGRWKKKKV